jgi:DNA repair exonuclease SbcCD ATPase subunit
MKICAIRLQNIRRFTDPVEITGIGPGLNVLAAPNEQGKSTIFDALHAAFFKDAKSWDKDIRALAPRAGGEPRVEVEIDLDGRGYRLEKQFQKASGKGEVRIWQGDSLYLQSDAAEAWLQQLIKSPKEGGPAGLLWVRQGLTDFADAKETLAARQDLMSSVVGEVDTITGGQRMDAIRRDVRQSLDRLVTSRGAKKGGALEQAATAVSTLEAREQMLGAKVVELRAQLDQRQVLRREQDQLQEPEVQQELQARVLQTQQDFAAAQQYQQKLQTAQQAVHTARLVLENQQSSLATLRARQHDCAEADAACKEAAQKLQQVTQALEPARAQLAGAAGTFAQAQRAAKAAEVLLAQVQQAELMAQAVGQRRALTQTLGQARKLQQQVTALKPLAAQGPDQNGMEQVEAAGAALALAMQVQDMAASALRVSYDAGQDGRLRLDGEALAGGTRISLPNGGRLEVPGVAVIELYPGQGAGADQLEQAQRDLTAALLAVNCEDVAQARAAHRSRQDAVIRLQEVEVQLQVLAPKGIMELMQQLDALPETPDESEAAAEPDRRAQVEAALTSSRVALDQAATALEAARSQEAQQLLSFEGSNVHHQAALQRLERAKAALGGQDDVAGALTAMESRQAALHQDLTAATAQQHALQQEAPDLEAAGARAQRAHSAQVASRERLQELGRDLAVLDSRIAITAGEAIEEELAEARDQLEAARKRLTAVEFEVAVLRRLDLALEQARSAAQEAYIGPVLQELQPLLRLLWPEARLGVDAGQVLPDQLQRAGQDEAFDTLSGGTQEQIALLVRLAFARLLARGGQAAPVILDDAIVYTDDARIEKIFDALTLQADEMQILVFTCRQKSFRALGGTQLAIRPVTGVA